MNIFHRDEEIDALRKRLAAGKSVLLHGPSGVGKTLLLQQLMPEFPQVLYCKQSSSPQAMFQAAAESLCLKRDPAMIRALRGRAIEAITAVSLKGIVVRILRESSHTIVLDHLNRPSHSLASAVRELMIYCSTPFVAVARSAHMEDAGFIAPLFPDRADKLAIKNFDSDVAEDFVCRLVQERQLRVENFEEFVGRMVEFSNGNPGAILEMVKMAGSPKYRLGDHVKLSTLYIDFRLQSSAAISGR